MKKVLYIALLVVVGVTIARNYEFSSRYGVPFKPTEKRILPGAVSGEEGRFDDVPFRPAY